MVEIWGVDIAVAAAHNSNTLVVMQAGNTVDFVVPAESVVEKAVEQVVEQLAVLVVARAAEQVVLFVEQVALKVCRMKIRSKEVWCRQLNR
ncbi:MAG: hypothetical protein JXA98_00515 [Methanosarcinaceae archaeon]|nr:hypothetical protein [Methanosarcinaceae archaeon]